jgi:hypothetical protein
MYVVIRQTNERFIPLFIFSLIKMQHVWEKSNMEYLFSLIEDYFINNVYR